MTREKTPTSPIGHNPEFGPCVYMNTTMMCSPAWMSLSHSAHAVYLAFLMQCAHERNGRLTMTLKQAKAEARVGSSATLVEALKALQTAGLIAVTWKADGSFEPTRYRLTEYPVPAGGDHPAQAATNDWENYQGAAPHGGNRSSAQKSTCQPENRSMEQVSTGAPA